MKAGDLIEIGSGCRNHWKLQSSVALLVEKLPRNDRLEYDWRVFIDGRYLELGRQIEQSCEVLSESR